jgi:hypothetical protein
MRTKRPNHIPKPGLYWVITRIYSGENPKGQWNGLATVTGKAPFIHIKAIHFDQQTGFVNSFFLEVGEPDDVLLWGPRITVPKKPKLPQDVPA